MSAAAFGSMFHGTEGRVLSAAEIRPILVERDSGVPAQSISLLAKLVTVLTGVVAGLTLEDRKRIPTTKSGLWRPS